MRRFHVFNLFNLLLQLVLVQHSLPGAQTLALVEVNADVDLSGGAKFTAALVEGTKEITKVYTNGLKEMKKPSLVYLEKEIHYINNLASELQLANDTVFKSYDIFGDAETELEDARVLVSELAGYTYRQADKVIHWYQKSIAAGREGDNEYSAKCMERAAQLFTGIVNRSIRDLEEGAEEYRNVRDVLLKLAGNLRSFETSLHTILAMHKQQILNLKAQSDPCASWGFMKWICAPVVELLNSHKDVYQNTLDKLEIGADTASKKANHLAALVLEKSDEIGLEHKKLQAWENVAGSIHEEMDEDTIAFLITELDDGREILDNLELLKKKAGEYQDALVAALFREKDRHGGEAPESIASSLYRGQH